MDLKPSYIFLVVVCSITCITGCDQKTKDITIKTDLATKAKSEVELVGVRFTVDQGIVTLNGECATQKAKDKVFKTVKGLYGVKDVVNNLRVAPVVIGTDFLLKQAVDSVLKKYAGVEAITKDSVVTLRGKVEGSKIATLNHQVMSLQPKRLEQQLESH